MKLLHLLLPLLCVGIKTTLGECPVGESSENPLGRCDCEGQFFMSQDCSEAFYCSADVPPEDDGCLFQCDEGEVVAPNLS